MAAYALPRPLRPRAKRLRVKDEGLIRFSLNLPASLGHDAIQQLIIIELQLTHRDLTCVFCLVRYVNVRVVNVAAQVKSVRVQL